MLGVVAGYPVYVFAITLNVGIVAGLALAVSLARRRGITPVTLLDIAVWVLPLGLLGARLWYAAVHWPEFAANPLTVLSIWEGGLALPGAITLGLPTAWIVLRAQHLPVGACLDAAAPGVALGQAIGRLGCLVAGCATGATVAPEGGGPALALPDSTGLVALRFPSPLVESGGDLLLCAVLLWLWTQRRAPGAVAGAYLLGYGLLRGAAEPFRGDSTPFGVAPAALWWSALAVVAGATALWRAWRRARARRSDQLHGQESRESRESRGQQGQGQQQAVATDVRLDP